MTLLSTVKKITVLLTAIVIFAGTAVSSEGKNIPSETVKTASGVIQVYRLKNGIPVYYRESRESSTSAFYIGVKGGVTYLKPEQSGLEDALFTMMHTSSAHYSYNERVKLAFTTQSNIGSYSIHEGSALTLSCLNYYAEKMLPVLLDGFTEPVYGDKEYADLMRSLKQQLQNEKNDPSSILMKTAARAVYKNHPYETSTDVTEDSIALITKENMESLHRQILDSRRIFVAVAGNTDIDFVLSRLNAYLGKIPALKTTPAAESVPAVTVAGEPVVKTHPSAAGTGFVLRVVSGPSVRSEDYIASCIASDMYSEVLFTIVREQHGICYTPQAFNDSSQAPVAGEFLYRVSNLTEFKKYTDEARSFMAAGKIGNSTVSERLPGFINAYINRKYSGQQTSAGLASRICAGMLQFGNVTQIEEMAGKAQAVTADDILRVFKKYWCAGEGRWFAVTGPADASKISF